METGAVLHEEIWLPASAVGRGITVKYILSEITLAHGGFPLADNVRVTIPTIASWFDGM
jgi:hypothetical protein